MSTQLEQKLAGQKKLSKEDKVVLKQTIEAKAKNRQIEVQPNGIYIKSPVQTNGILLGFISGGKFKFSTYFENQLGPEIKNTLLAILERTSGLDAKLFEKKYEDHFLDNGIMSDQSSDFEDFIKKVRDSALSEVRKKYSHLFFDTQTTLSKVEINNQLKKFNPKLGQELSNPKSHIKPDGGLIFIQGKENKYLIAVPEAKKQGTNDLRAEDGKENQAMGNAIERTSKNCMEINNYLIAENICPYIVFINGCDFAQGSSILDRVTSITRGLPFNQNNVQNIAPQVHSASVYVQDTIISSWTEAEKLQIFERYKTALVDLMTQSIEYYLAKYPTDFSF